MYKGENKVSQHNYLFFINDDKVSVFNYDSKSKDNPFKAEKNKGEEEFSIKEEKEFWDWWKETVSYTNEDGVDFCFIYDCQNDIISHDFVYYYCNIMPKKSMWTKQKLNAFFKCAEVMKKYASITLVTDNAEEISFGKRLENFDYKQFYTNVYFEQEKKETSQYYVEQENMSIMAQYYREKLNEDNKK